MPAPARLDNVQTTALALGEVLEAPASEGRFRVTGFIGRGKMGEVYLAETEGTGAPVAIKTLPLARAHDPKLALRTQFESEGLVGVLGAGAGSLATVRFFDWLDTAPSRPVAQPPPSVRRADRSKFDRPVHFFCQTADLNPMDL
jgi:hypothetical protein